MNKRLIALVVALLLALSVVCDGVVISDGGVSTERDVMIYEAAQN